MKKWIPQLKLDITDWIAILVFSIPAFYMLGTPAIYIWDEAVYAIASLDMANGGSWWVPVHDAYNTKPPLVLWMQAFFLHFIPSPEWAIRLPSALAVTGILFLIAAAMKRWGFDRLSRLLVMVCFVSHEGFIRHHISRTGDLDAVMVFFVVMYTLVFLDARYQDKWTRKHTFFFLLAVLLAFYAKSIAGWIMLGPLGILWLISPIRNELWTRRFWMGSVLVFCLCLFYYVSRAWIQPDFPGLVWTSEYSRALKNVMPWHEHEFSYYFRNFRDLHFFYPWIYYVLAAVAAALFIIRERWIRFHMLGWTILGFGYITLVSIPPVKLEWYDAPAYPFFAMILGAAIGYGAKKIQGSFYMLLVVPIVFVFIRKLQFIASDLTPRHPFEYEGAMVRQINKATSLKVYMRVEVPEHRLQLDFYHRIKTLNGGATITVVDNISQLIPGDTLLISQDKGILEIQSQFDIDTIRIWPGLGYEMVINGKK